MRSAHFVPMFVVVAILATQFFAESSKAREIRVPRAYYTCDMMGGHWTDIKEGGSFTCPKSKEAHQPSGGLHCESECTFLKIAPSGKSEKKVIRSPSGMSRAFTFINLGDKIKIVSIK